uniref:Protein Nef n=1 Tax=Human immunodeficiency virus type 1 TaxID=11676 RepID=U6BJZ8_HV1|nr:nef protein [Human immunodeficiency virus 1]
MGGNWSKSSIVGWPAIRERIRRTNPATERVRAAEPATEGAGAASRDLGRHGAITSSNIAQEEDEEEVGFPVRPQVPLRPMTYKGALDLSHFLKEKGGLDGMVWSSKRQEILDLWVYNTQGYFPDWQNYTPGPGIRYPLTFGWCYELVPVDPEEVEKETEGENNCLLHPMNQHGMDDLEREVLKWRFNSRLAFVHMAREKHPEFYKDC